MGGEHRERQHGGGHQVGGQGGGDGGDNVMVSRLLEAGDSVTAVVDGVIKLGAGMMMMTPAQHQHTAPCPGLALELHLLPLPGLPRPLLLVARETCRVDLLDRGEQGWDKVCSRLG